MRDYVGTFWRFQHAWMEDCEFLVVQQLSHGKYVVLETKTNTFHPAQVHGWSDVLWVHRYYRGKYFDNRTLVPVECLKPREIRAL